MLSKLTSSNLLKRHDDLLDIYHSTLYDINFSTEGFMSVTNNNVSIKKCFEYEAELFTRSIKCINHY